MLSSNCELNYTRHTVTAVTISRKTGLVSAELSHIQKGGSGLTGKAYTSVRFMSVTEWFQICPTSFFFLFFSPQNNIDSNNGRT
jgi:hypothetical protein